MKTIEVKIKGLSPGLLMHKFGLEEQAKVAAGGGPVTGIDKPDVAAEKAAYRLASNGVKGNLYIPGENVRSALVAAATYSKGKRGSSLAKFAAAAIFVNPEAIDLGTHEYAIDSRPVVIAATKGRVLRHRPHLKEWEASFTIDYDDALLNADQMRQIVDDCGSKVGLLDFRPAKRGPFGRFMVTNWKAS